MRADFVAAVACREDTEALDRLAYELRTNRRKRQMADGLSIQEAFDLFFAEQASRTGGR